MAFTLINPKSLGSPSGYSNGVLIDAGKLLFIAGQIAWNENQKIVSEDFVEQFDRALENVIAVLKTAGGEPTNVVRLVIYVTSKDEYRERLLDRIKAKAQGKSISAPEKKEEEGGGEVVDIMEALRRSLGGKKPAPPRARRAPRRVATKTRKRKAS